MLAFDSLLMLIIVDLLVNFLLDFWCKIVFVKTKSIGVFWQVRELFFSPSSIGT